jgi:hypothetical protein
MCESFDETLYRSSLWWSKYVAKREKGIRKEHFVACTKYVICLSLFGCWRVVIIVSYRIYDEANRFSADDDGKCWNTCAAISFAWILFFFFFIWFDSLPTFFVRGRPLKYTYTYANSILIVYIFDNIFQLSCSLLFWWTNFTCVCSSSLVWLYTLTYSITCHWSSLAI